MKISFAEPSNRLLYWLAGCIKRIILLPRFSKLKQVELTGKIDNSESDLRLIYIGDGENLEYLKDLFFNDIKHEKTIELPLWHLREHVKKLRSQDNFIFIEINRLLDFMIPSGGFLTFPWIKQKVFLNNKISPARTRSIEGTFGRKVRQNSYSFKIVRDEASVSKFYDEMLAPYIKHKYKHKTHMRSLREIQAEVRSGFLLQIFDSDQWVSGVVCRRKKKEVTAFAFGLIPDYDYHLQRGALSAAYYFLFEWARENSIDTIDLMRSRPNAVDGVYEHKRRWGAEPAKDIWPHTSLWIFTPERSDIPLVLKKQLVWNGEGFTELKQLI